MLDQENKVKSNAEGGHEQFDHVQVVEVLEPNMTACILISLPQVHQVHQKLQKCERAAKEVEGHSFDIETNRGLAVLVSEELR